MSSYLIWCRVEKAMGSDDDNQWTSLTQISRISKVPVNRGRGVRLERLTYIRYSSELYSSPNVSSIRLKRLDKNLLVDRQSSSVSGHGRPWPALERVTSHEIIRPVISKNFVHLVSKKSLHTSFVSLVLLLRMTVYKVGAFPETIQDIYLQP